MFSHLLSNFEASSSESPSNWITSGLSGLVVVSIWEEHDFESISAMVD